MERVTSGDGTAIAFERFGDGPPVVLVGPGPSWYDPLAEELAEHFTVFNYDRRGRGESGDTAPYAVEREIEDLGAIISEAGGVASVYGHSSGAALALRAAAHGLPIDGLVLHEPPYAPGDDEEGKRAWRELAATIKKLLAEGRRGDAIAHVFNNTGLPREMAEDLMPLSAEELSRDEGVLAMAHTFAYDLEITGDGTDGTVPTDVAGAVPAPALVLSDEADYPWAIGVGELLAGALQKGRHVLLKSRDPEEELYAGPEVLAQTVAGFLTDRDNGPDRTGR